MKTAKISVYIIHGTFNYCVDVLYKRKILASFDRRVLPQSANQKQSLIDHATRWAMNTGFTRIKLC